MKYKGIETSIPLLVAYEVLALAYKKAPSLRNTGLVIKNITRKNPKPLPTMDYANYNQSFALLILNASIIEGTLRTILSENLYDDIEYLSKKEVSEGLTVPSKSQKLLQKFQSEVENQGGWEKLKEQHNFYLDIAIEDSLSENTKEAINALFVLRNVLAHGTALVHPSSPMNESMKDIYPYNWQRKLQRAKVYLEKEFGHADIFENMAEFGVPEHFLNATKTMFAELEGTLGAFPPRASKTLKLLNDYAFGYINLSR